MCDGTGWYWGGGVKRRARNRAIGPWRGAPTPEAQSTAKERASLPIAHSQLPTFDSLLVSRLASLARFCVVRHTIAFMFSNFAIMALRSAGLGAYCPCVSDERQALLITYRPGPGRGAESPVFGGPYEVECVSHHFGPQKISSLKQTVGESSQTQAQACSWICSQED